MLNLERESSENGPDDDDLKRSDLSKTLPTSKKSNWAWKNKLEKEKRKEDEKKQDEKREKEKGRKTIKLAEVKEMNKEQKAHLDTFLLSYSLQKLPGTTWRFYLLDSTKGEETHTTSASNSSGNLLCGRGMGVPSTGSKETFLPTSIPTSSLSSSSTPNLLHEKDIFVKSSVPTGGPLQSSSAPSTPSPSETLFLLPCGTARPEAYFELMLNLSERFQVIAPSFPVELNEFDDYVAGLILIMRHLKVKKIHLHGTSFSAAVALYFFFKHPEKVLSLVLSHLILPNDQWVRQCERFLKKMEEKRSLFLVRSLSGFAVKREDLMLEVSNIRYEEVEFWYHLFKNFGASKQALTSITEALTEYHDNHSYTADDFEEMSDIPILIIDSRKSLQIMEGDYLEEIRALFSHSKHFSEHVFEGEGHLYSVVRVKEVTGILQQFWAQHENLTKQSKSPNKNTHHHLHVSSSPIPPSHPPTHPHTYPHSLPNPHSHHVHHPEIEKSKTQQDLS